MRAFAAVVPWVLGLALVLVTLPAAGNEEHGATEPVSEADLGGYLEGASVLEGRLLAPCCWNQTLDIHGSEVSNGLRREIRRRLREGETVAAIEADLVSRYGERIRAVPTGNPLAGFATGLAVLFGGAGAGAIWMLSRWRKRRIEQLAREPQGPDKKRDQYDDEIDAELDRL